MNNETKYPHEQMLEAIKRKPWKTVLKYSLAVAAFIMASLLGTIMVFAAIDRDIKTVLACFGAMLIILFLLSPAMRWHHDDQSSHQNMGISGC